MKEIFWNNKGLCDQAKPRFLYDLVKENQLDFIAILESKKSDFTQPELVHFCANKFFYWQWTLPKGRSGGILLGVNMDKVCVLECIHDNFFLKFKLLNKVDIFEWILIAVYGAAHEEKEKFLRELV
jgi:hypothetical protein